MFIEITILMSKILFEVVYRPLKEGIYSNVESVLVTTLVGRCSI